MTRTAAVCQPGTPAVLVACCPAGPVIVRASSRDDWTCRACRTLGRDLATFTLDDHAGPPRHICDLALGVTLDPYGGLDRPDVDDDPGDDPFALAEAGSNQAGQRWTPEEAAAVDRAIAAVADRLDRFTADDVWREVADTAPVTKGLTGRLTAAARRGLIASTPETVKANRGGTHDHAQRLTVWRSLIGPAAAAGAA